MTPTAMPLASVWVMILLTSPSMAAPLGIVCETAATGRQQAARTTVKNGGRTLFCVPMAVPGTTRLFVIPSSGAYELCLASAQISETEGKSSTLSRSCRMLNTASEVFGWEICQQNGVAGPHRVLN